MKASELWLLYALDDGAPHSQKQICQEWGLPKTTLNTTLKQAEAKGVSDPRPHRGEAAERQICLTAAGQAYARQVLRPIYGAEDAAPPGHPGPVRAGGGGRPGGGRGLLRPVPAGQLCQTNGGKGERRQPMRTFLRFLKPYRGLCLLTLLVMALDVAGALYLPTIVADMINIGVAGGTWTLSCARAG